MTRSTTIPHQMTSTAAARAVGVVKSYGTGPTAVRALDSVDVEIARGEFTAIMGPSGSGKSTLMHCLAGLDTVSAGSVFLGDVELRGLSDKKMTALRRDRIGFVFQSFNLVPTLTALENITLPIAIAGRRPDAEWLGPGGTASPAASVCSARDIDGLSPLPSPAAGRTRNGWTRWSTRCASATG